MARRSIRLSAGGSADTGKHKRHASGSANVNVANKRPKQQDSSPETDPSDQDDAEEKESASSDETASEFGDNRDDVLTGSEDATDSPHEQGDEYDESDDDKPKPRGLKAQRGTRGDAWKHGVKSGLGPGKQLIIKKPKAWPAGKVPYTDDTIHPNTLAFLDQLKANNEREWLKLHDEPFRQAEKDFYSFVEAVTSRLVDIDETIPELPIKDIVFRVYRDVRFSKDKTPYKPLFSVAWQVKRAESRKKLIVHYACDVLMQTVFRSRTGRKSEYAGYYLQIAPNNGSFVGAGKWSPEAPALNAIRTAIDQNPRGLKDVLTGEKLRKEIFGGAKMNEANVMKAFIERSSENALVKRPKGYDADHPDIGLLRLRSFTVKRSLGAHEILGKAGTDRVVEILSAVEPLVTYLNSVIMPDANGSGNEESDNEVSLADE